MTPTTWRFISTGPMAGPANMAVDEALLHNFDPDASAPVLRLYGWNPPALSIGRFQKATEVLDLGLCAACKIPVVRRITGGGVIYHADELTYSLVCAPRHIPETSSIKESFRVLTSFLLRFYEKLGLSACYAVDHEPAGVRLGVRADFCFAGKESYDILISGRKIGGNAQRRLKNAIFQHGSIPLANRAGLGAHYLLQRPDNILDRTTSLSDNGVAADPEELNALMAGAFAEALHVGLAPSCLSSTEEQSVAELLALKYQDERWNVGDMDRYQGGFSSVKTYLNI